MRDGRLSALFRALRAVSGRPLRARATHTETLEADIQPTLKLGFTLHYRSAAKSPHCQFFTMLLKGTSKNCVRPDGGVGIGPD